MKLSISDIAWSAEQDNYMYQMMQDNGFTGLEIAPTRIFPMNPYDRLEDAAAWSRQLFERYGFRVSSMQSIWYGRTENMFGSVEERESLIAYTKKAIDFAQAIGCDNLVFGCPKNRNVSAGMPGEKVEGIAILFFRELGEYAYAHNTVLSMEANPPIYNTNFINDTASAIELIKKVNSKGFLLNLDIGTMIENGEDADVLSNDMNLINHVHISEPGLAPIKKRMLHEILVKQLRKSGYEKFVSIEMGNYGNNKDLESAIKYGGKLF